jgi:hypothetical protein
VLCPPGCGDELDDDCRKAAEAHHRTQVAPPQAMGRQVTRKNDHIEKVADTAGAEAEAKQSM